MVSNICVHAHSDAKQPIAIIIPHEPHLRQVLGGSDRFSGLSEKPLPELCANSDVRNLVLKECIAVAKKAGFKSIELLQGVILVSDEWTPESGLVTAAQKLQRKKIEQKYQREIDVCGLFPACFCLPLLVLNDLQLLQETYKKAQG